MKTHILGLPRIGEKRQLKFALENYWQQKISKDELIKISNEIKESNWQLQAQNNLDFVTVGDFSWYDQVLDTSILFNVIPKRFNFENEDDLNTYFCIARGQAPNKSPQRPSAMTKWFDTNYHYIIPELASNQKFDLNSKWLIDEIKHAQSLGHKVKPVILGPLTFLYLSKCSDKDFNKLSLLEPLLIQYQQLIKLLKDHNIEWVQIDEPILVQDITDEYKQAFIKSYQALKNNNIKILLTTYFGEIDDYLDWLSDLPVDGIHLDLSHHSIEQISKFINKYTEKKVVSLGIINGRNIWKSNFEKIVNDFEKINLKHINNIWISSSCSLLHVPYNLELETTLDPQIKDWLAFAKQKTLEIADIKYILENPKEEKSISLIQKNSSSIKSRKESQLTFNNNVRNIINSLTNSDFERKSKFSERIKLQQKELNLPILPTTTIGSFPQTIKIRNIRKDYKTGKLTSSQYEDLLKEEIKETIKIQEKIGLDVLVHGEPERNDMVEYFGQNLSGFVATAFAWVQSYGSRCVKPPIIYGDIERKQAITVEWSKYSQSLSDKYVKGMLTGPITILSWSFVRDDIPLEETAKQLAIALRDEVNDLEQAGIKIIQIDEPAFKERYPLKQHKIPSYISWAVNCFKLASSGVADTTQIHTHMCYSAFNDIINEITLLDADVITIECARSDMDLLNAFKKHHYPNQVGPGVYDIHSPNIPTEEDIYVKIKEILNYIPASQLWINPDCGLKTRSWEQVIPSLQNMVDATIKLRDEFKQIN